MSKLKLKSGARVTPKETYRQQNGEVGEKLEMGKTYEVDSWFSFYHSTMVILTTGQYVYKQQLSFL